jgi:hypothetical protein
MKRWVILPGRTVFITNNQKGNMMHKLIALSFSSAVLLIPSISSALTVHGDIHPERYTFS